MSIRALVVDDEPLARERLQRLLTEQGVEVVAHAKDGVEALEIVSEYDVDIIFLDINMPKMTGLEVADKLSTIKSQVPSIVFCTAYDEFALDAFNTNAEAYLLKPVGAEALSKSIEQAMQLTKLQLKSVQEQSLHDVLPVTIDNVVENIKLAEIACFQSIDKHVYAFVENRSEVLINYSLVQLEEMLPDQFLRVHRNALVNISHITKLLKDEAGHTQVIVGSGSKSLQVSRRHLPTVKKCLTKN